MPLGPQGFYNKLDHHHDDAKEWVVVNWNLGNMCNYNCSYCPPSLNNGSFGWSDYETVIAFINECTNHYAPRKIYFEFTRGEVTLWRDFVKCSKYIKESGHDVGFISNGSRTIRWWEKNKNLFDHVCLSFHAEHADPEHYLQVVKIMSRECRTHCNIMMHYREDLWNICKNVAEKIIEISDISLALQPLIVDFGDTLYDYTGEQTHYIDRQWHDLASKIQQTRKHDKKLYRGSMDMIDEVNNLRHNTSSHRFINDKTNNWNGWDCWAGVEQFVVDFDGSLMRGWCRVGGVFGNMKELDKINWPDIPIRCNKNMCHCNFDIMTKKILPVDSYYVDESNIEES